MSTVKSSRCGLLLRRGWPCDLHPCFPTNTLYFTIELPNGQIRRVRIMVLFAAHDQFDLIEYSRLLVLTAAATDLARFQLY